MGGVTSVTVMLSRWKGNFGTPTGNKNNVLWCHHFGPAIMHINFLDGLQLSPQHTLSLFNSSLSRCLWCNKKLHTGLSENASLLMFVCGWLCQLRLFSCEAMVGINWNLCGWVKSIRTGGHAHTRDHGGRERQLGDIDSAGCSFVYSRYVSLLDLLDYREFIFLGLTKIAKKGN